MSRTHTPAKASTDHAADAPRVEAWGRLAYATALQRQLETASRITGAADGAGAARQEVLAIVEHPPVVTLGRHAPASDVLVDASELERRGIEVARSDRGGRATYHGPGQAVVYPIVDIAGRGIGVKEWVSLLEDALIEMLAAYGVEGGRIQGRPGIWTGAGDGAAPAQQAKIASIGLRVARGVSYHGISINVEPESKLGFQAIVTCGIESQRVTSIADEIGDAADTPIIRRVAARFEPPTVERVAARFVEALTQRLHDRPRMTRTLRSWGDEATPLADNAHPAAP